MSNILGDLSAPSLVAAIKANQFAWWRALGRSPKAEFYDSPEVTSLLTGLPNPSVNTVLLAQVEPEDVDAIIKDTRAHFESRGVTTVSW